MTIAGPPEARPADGLAIDFVVVSDRAQLGEIVQRVRDGRLWTNIGNVATLDDAVAFHPTERITGKTIISVSPQIRAQKAAFGQCSSGDRPMPDWQRLQAQPEGGREQECVDSTAGEAGQRTASASTAAVAVGWPCRRSALIRAMSR